jgi:hypothetical protein
MYRKYTVQKQWRQQLKRCLLTLPMVSITYMVENDKPGVSDDLMNLLGMKRE